MADGRFNVGGILSRTVILKEADPVLPDLSVAEQDTTVEPMAKVEPEAGVQVGLMTPSTLSSAVALNVTTAPRGTAASTVMSDGTVTTGDVLS
jgi:hypothetical protein